MPEMGALEQALGSHTAVSQPVNCDARRPPATAAPRIDKFEYAGGAGAMPLRRRQVLPDEASSW